MSDGCDAWCIPILAAEDCGSNAKQLLAEAGHHSSRYNASRETALARALSGQDMKLCWIKTFILDIEQGLPVAPLKLPTADVLDLCVSKSDFSVLDANLLDGGISSHDAGLVLAAHASQLLA